MNSAAQLPMWVEYVRALTPALAALFAIPAAILAWKSYQYNRKADRRSNHWSQLSWAMDQAASDEDARVDLGVLALEQMIKWSRLSDPEKEAVELFLQKHRTKHEQKPISDI